jgi:hypothetical protein
MDRPQRIKINIFDGLVKSLSAALRFNPAPLDNNLALGIKDKPPDIRRGKAF